MGQRRGDGGGGKGRSGEEGGAGAVAGEMKEEVEEVRCITRIHTANINRDCERIEHFLLLSVAPLRT